MPWNNAISTAITLADGDCGLTDGSQARDWHLPTKEEWEGFVDTSYIDPVLSNAVGDGKREEGDPFDNVQSYWYWSSTEYAHITTGAWDMNMSNGIVGITNKSHDGLNVSPVRMGN